jgi:hypothetical protein
MTVSKLKSILDGFDDDSNVTISIEVDNKKPPVLTYDIGFDKNEHGELMLEVAVYDADFDY